MTEQNAPLEDIDVHLGRLLGSETMPVEDLLAIKQQGLAMMAEADRVIITPDIPSRGVQRVQEIRAQSSQGLEQFKEAARRKQREGIKSLGSRRREGLVPN